MSLPFGMVGRAGELGQIWAPRAARGPTCSRRSLIRPPTEALPPSHRTAQQPQIILLKEGTDTSQGKPQLISNINACVAVADVVRTTLGPRGMDKLMHDDRVSGEGSGRQSVVPPACRLAGCWEQAAAAALGRRPEAAAGGSRVGPWVSAGAPR